MIKKGEGLGRYSAVANQWHQAARCALPPHRSPPEAERRNRPRRHGPIPAHARPRERQRTQPRERRASRPRHQTTRCSYDYFLPGLILDPDVAVQTNAFLPLLSPHHDAPCYTEVSHVDRPTKGQCAVSTLDPPLAETGTQLSEDQRGNLRPCRHRCWQAFSPRRVNVRVDRRLIGTFEVRRRELASEFGQLDANFRSLRKNGHLRIFSDRQHDVRCARP